MTVSQNYRRLGLSSRLNDAAGGTEKKAHGEKEHEAGGDNEKSLSLSITRPTGKILPQEAQVERDPATGHILRIIRPISEEAQRENRKRLNPLDDPLNDLENHEQEVQPISSSVSGVIAQLEAQAAEEAHQIARSKRPRQQSQREEEWLRNLVEKHGDNITAMVRDRKLNPMQQTEGDIRRRIKVWHERGRRSTTDATSG